MKAGLNSRIRTRICLLPEYFAQTTATETSQTTEQALVWGSLGPGCSQSSGTRPFITEALQETGLLEAAGPTH